MTNCIKWSGSINPLGYGTRYFRKKMMNAHRAAWIEKHGEVAKGIDIDHLCRNRACVNLKHLRAITHRENLMSGQTVAAMNSRKTKCINGHDFSPENTYRNPAGSRECRICRKAQHEKSR